MSKHRLLLDDDYSFLAFGLSCHLKDYRVAWHLNKALNKTFVRQSIELDVRPGQIETFAKFNSRDEDSHLNYILLSNQNEDSYLFKNYKQYDYFLFIEGYIDIFDKDEFMRMVQQIESFQFIGQMESENFHRIQFALFED